MVEEQWLEVVCLNSGGCCDKKRSPSEWQPFQVGRSGWFWQPSAFLNLNPRRERRNLGLCTDTSQTVKPAVRWSGLTLRVSRK